MHDDETLETGFIDCSPRVDADFHGAGDGDISVIVARAKADGPGDFGILRGIVGAELLGEFGAVEGVLGQGSKSQDEEKEEGARRVISGGARGGTFGRRCQ